MNRVGLVAAAAVALAAAPAHADLASGRDKLVAGDYKTAITELTKVSGKDKPAARLLLARADLETGDYAAAESIASALVQGKDAVAIAAHLVLDELRRITGRGGDARKDLEQLYKDHPDDR